MKKTYIAPETLVLNVELTAMISASLPINSGVSGDAAYAPRHNDWDIWGSSNAVEVDD